MRKLYHIGLESYRARYTYQLEQWYESVFKQRNINYVIVQGETLTSDQAIVTGQVLDAHGRSYYSMTQLAELVKLMKAGEITDEDVILFEDMFTPGIESIPYILNQVDSSYRPRVFVRCLAQSIDPDDFVHVWGMSKWMGHYEKMVCELVRDSGGAVLATNEEMVMHMKVAGWDCPIYNISGLAFGKAEVRARVPGELKPFKDRTYRVGFAARWDREKSPNFYMDLIEEYHRLQAMPYNDWPRVEFAIFSGSKLKSNDNNYMERTRRLVAEGKLVVYEDLEKNDYYALLNDTRVLFNCALQDWVSNTASEADTLGANILYPAYRSFPEAFANDHRRLYTPWSIQDAMEKLVPLLQNTDPNMGKFSAWNDGTIDRICDILECKGEQWNRSMNDYRKYTLESKY